LTPGKIYLDVTPDDLPDDLPDELRRRGLDAVRLGTFYRRLAMANNAAAVYPIAIFITQATAIVDENGVPVILRAIISQRQAVTTFPDEAEKVAKGMEGVEARAKEKLAAEGFQVLPGRYTVEGDA